MSMYRNNIVRLQKEIANLSKQISAETKKEADLVGKILLIEKSINKSTSESHLRSKQSDVQRKQSEIARVQSKKAELLKKEADKSAQLYKYKQSLVQEEERERKKIIDAEKRREREQLDFQRQLQRAITNTQRVSSLTQNMMANPSTAEYDVFISHAYEDKENFVRPLAETLNARGIKVWYDEFTLRVGDSLRRSIDQGLVQSKYGTVVLSSSFFSKNWPQYELDGMVTKEMSGHRMILPIWYKVSKTEVVNFSPTLADRVALNSSLNSIEEIAEQLIEVIRG